MTTTNPTLDLAEARRRHDALVADPQSFLEAFLCASEVPALIAEVERQRGALDHLAAQFQARCDEPEQFVDLDGPDTRGHLLAMSQAFGIAAEMVREAAGGGGS